MSLLPKSYFSINMSVSVFEHKRMDCADVDGGVVVIVLFQFNCFHVMCILFFDKIAFVMTVLLKYAALMQ